MQMNNTFLDGVVKWSCQNGHFEVAKWLVELGKLSNTPLNIHVHGEHIR